MPRPSKRLTLHQKALIREHYKKTLPTYAALCQWVNEQFGLTPHSTTVARIVNDPREAEYIDPKATTSRCNLQSPKHPALEKELYEWIIHANNKNCCLTGEIILRKAEQLAVQMEVGSVTRLTKGWLYRFQQRRGLKMYRLHGEAGSVSQQTVNDGRHALLAQTALFDRSDNYNMDETGVFYNAQPSTTISNEPRHGTKKDKSRLSVVLTANTDGSDKRPLMFIGKAKKPRCFGNLVQRDLGILYRNNRKAWMTIALFSEWIRDLNDDMRRQNKLILLLLDNASSHNAVDVELTNVRVLLLPPNTTSWLQPMDAGIIASFKALYKRRQIDNVIKILEREEEVDESVPTRKMYCVDVLTAMRWMEDAWSDVTRDTVVNCWRHTGILPRTTLAAQIGSLRVAPLRIRDLLT